MKLSNKQKIFISIFSALILILVSFYIFYKQKAASRSISQTDVLKYNQTSLPEDNLPLPTKPHSQTIKIPILMYHHIGQAPQNADATRRDMTVSVDDFAAQVKWLSDNSYSSIKLSDINSYILGKSIIPKKVVIFTFDDGYEDALANAVPILKQYGFIGSFGIITQFVGQQQGDNLYASWKDIADISEQGMEIVSHTQNHFDGTNPKFSADFIFQNLTGSINDIQNHLGFATNILIYPYGHYNQIYIDQAKKADFKIGVTVHEGSTLDLTNLMEIPRIRVHGNEDLKKFENLILF